MSLEQILEADKGSIIAPAGCGKTQMIADAISYQQEKPYLVLTHTTAGVAALKKRLSNVPSSHYRVATIAGWALNIAGMFPQITGYSAPTNGPPNYNALQNAVGNLCMRGDLNDALNATYCRAFVDEYQDCNTSQHLIVSGLSQSLPTVIFGDPLQSVFDFSGPLPDWDNVVLQAFPQLSFLDTPWRWINSNNPQLGEWILSIREQLLEGNSIDLESCQTHVSWKALGSDQQQNIQNQIGSLYELHSNTQRADRILVIGDSRNRNARHQFARSVNGLGVVEPVDLGDVIDAARRFGSQNGAGLLDSVLDATSDMMTGVNKSKLVSRVDTIVNQRNRTEPQRHELAAVRILQDSSPNAIHELLTALEDTSETSLFRHDAFYALKESTNLASTNPSLSIHESSEIIRERRRHRGDKRIPFRAIGSTLLLKGLESEHALILNADNMNSRNLYVALSRGSKSVTVFSSSKHVG